MKNLELHLILKVILKLFKNYKEKSFDMLEGMFSIAIYNIKKKIYLTRDIFGIKPLFILLIKQDLSLVQKKII